MAKLTKADAARQLGISRTTLYKFIEQGRLSATPEGLIDQAEFVRFAPQLDAHRARPLTPLHATVLDAVIPNNEPYERPVDRESVQYEHVSTARQLTSTLEAVVDILRGQLQAAQERESRLLQMLHESHLRYERLLEAPRTTVIPLDATPSAPPSTPASTNPPAGVVDVTTRMPAYNPDRHYLGALCKRGHDWQGTEQSLRKRSSKGCLACDAEGQRRRRQGRPPQ